MAKREAKTDLWVYDLLKEANIELEPQGSSIKEIEEALKTASKNMTKKSGRPEFVGVVKDFLIVIEDKKDLSKHIKIKNDVINQDKDDVKNYAVNGALFYGIHLVKNTNYKKVIAFGVSGDEKRHRITPIFINERGDYTVLDDVESFISFNDKNINEYYVREILKEDTDYDKELKDILKDAKELHEDLRNYGNLKDIDKPLIVSGILLALREREYSNFSIDDLTGDEIKTDGQKIFEAIKAHLRRVNVSPEVKRDKILSQFSIIKDMKILNEINPTLNKTPLRHFAEFLDERIYKSIKYSKSSEDYLGRFYGEFMAYSGGDGQTLGIVLTPKHITDLFCDLVDIKPSDVVLDPTAGTGGFLIAAMHHMLKKATTDSQKQHIKERQLFGIELQPYMFTIATTNMILRGDGKSNLINEDFFKISANKLQLWGANIGFMNPPYSQGSSKNPELYEISFIEHLLNSLTIGGKAVVIVPQSTMTGKTKIEKEIKENILKKHTLEGVITLNPDTFYGIGVMPVIAVFTAHKPHPEDKEVKFIDFRDDGYVVNKHIGLIETEAAKDRKQHLLDVWFDRIEAPTKFCVKTTIKPDDEWLHSFYYFNDEIPKIEEFEKVVNDYLTFEFSMVMEGKEWLFKTSQSFKNIQYNKIPNLEHKTWKEFDVGELFNVKNSKPYHKKDLDFSKKELPYITRTNLNNGVEELVKKEEDFKINPKNSIVFGAENVKFFFEPFEYITGNKMYVITLKDNEINIFVGLFLVTVFDKSVEGCGFGYGQGLTGTREKRRKILLPITNENNHDTPDWEYMEQFIKNLLYKKYSKYFEYKKN